MNKQELASKIWASTNQLRGNIELGTYKDYMLSLLFYKFLSDKEVTYLLNQGWTEDDLKFIDEDDLDSVADCQRNIGYFISYGNLFSTWIKLEHDFTVSNVTDALNAFNRLIGESHRKVFTNIFETLQSNISNLGTTAADQTKALRKLIETINDIPTDQAQGYDVLGFIYEFLIGNFAANAGKKAGEFYTPHEVSVLMSEIVCHHLQGRDTIRIMDPTSGSGSLLITIGKTFTKYSDGTDNVEYYAQEFIKSTYNLTRMNLIMKGILPNNIHVRNGDTLASDWPYFDDSDPENTYFPLPVDAVVSNPPYSQKWDPSDRDGDPRFSNYGLAPKGKADYAFLLYDLYHIRPDGIAAVILPHGVLFRGNEEGTIRKNLIENNKIDTIIGLPANLFFGTGIPTIMMILKQKRENTDVLFIDASKGFIKNGNKNKLRARDIKKIADTVNNRVEVTGYSRVVTKAEIIDNDYNLNIPRYVDSSDSKEKWDAYSLIFGGIPAEEIDDFSDYWSVFPSLREQLFVSNQEGYSCLKSESVKDIIKNNRDVQKFERHYKDVFSNFGEYLYNRWLNNPGLVAVSTEEDQVTEEVFKRYSDIPLVDPYAAFQVLDDQFAILMADLELIQTEGFLSSVRQIDPKMVVKKKDEKTIEVQDGWKGHILPFELIQDQFFPKEIKDLKGLEETLNEIQSEYDEILGTLSQEELESSITNDDGTAFVSKGINEKLKEIFDDVSSPEIVELKKYLAMVQDKTGKSDLLDFISTCRVVNWEKMDKSKNGTYAKKAVTQYLKELQQNFTFEEDSFESKVLRVNQLLENEKTIKAQLKSSTAELNEKVINRIKSIADSDAKEILRKKWIEPLIENIMSMPDQVINQLVSGISGLSQKYLIPLETIEMDILRSESILKNQFLNLVGDEHDISAFNQFAAMLGGKDNE